MYWNGLERMGPRLSRKARHESVARSINGGADVQLLVLRRESAEHHFLRTGKEKKYAGPKRHIGLHPRGSYPSCGIVGPEGRLASGHGAKIAVFLVFHREWGL